DFAVWGVDDKRRAKIGPLRNVFPLPNRVVIMNVGSRLPQVLVETRLEVLGRFGLREDRLVGKLRGALERRKGVVRPVALKVGLAVRGARDRPGSGTRGRFPSLTAVDDRREQGAERRRHDNCSKPLKPQQDLLSIRRPSKDHTLRQTWPSTDITSSAQVGRPWRSRKGGAAAMSIGTSAKRQ